MYIRYNHIQLREGISKSNDFITDIYKMTNKCLFTLRFYIDIASNNSLREVRFSINAFRLSNAKKIQAII
jgi:hypothetical protein